MNPDPRHDHSEKMLKTHSPMPTLPLKTDYASYSSANRKTNTCSIQRLYPWLLFASTAISATFCLAYITKPVIFSSPSPATQSQTPKDFAANNRSSTDRTAAIVPDGNKLPGEDEKTPGTNGSNVTLASDFEETNIRIQHVLDAEFPSGDVSRIIVDVPVLYRSRSLRWTQEETARARSLLDRLAVYQEQIRSLRGEGNGLLEEWNSLISESIPAAALRADSPSLPANQQDDFAPGSTRGSDTVDTIKLQHPEE